MLRRSTIQLLRFHFSFFLLPVYLFALSQTPVISWPDALIIFFLLHILVYPSSNGYNSCMDKDTTPIGGLSNPLQPTNQLLYTTIFFDVLAIGLSFLVSIFFFAGIVLYILASKAYSYRGIRLKKYPVIGYFLVILCQGGLIFFLVYHGCSVNKTLSIPLLPMMAAVCLIGGYYPLTQIYQHEADLSDGVKTISWLLGKRGTFIFCGSVFAAATLLMFFTFYRQGELRYFLIYLFCMCPMVIFFSRWMQKVWKNERNADFKHSLLMNVLASLCTTICFSVLLIIKIF